MVKGSKGASSSSRKQSVPRDPDYPQVEFRDLEHKKEFENIKVRPVYDSRFFDDDFLKAIGLYTPLKELFILCNLGPIFEEYNNSCAFLVYEMLSSVTEDMDDRGMRLFCFRLCNKDWSLSCNNLPI